MNGATLLDLTLGRLGKWNDTALRATVLAEMNLVQFEYEQGPNLPWFLFDTRTFTVAAGDVSARFPANFIRFDDDAGYVQFKVAGIWQATSEIIPFEKISPQLGTITAGYPTHVSVFDQLYVYPTPLDALEGRLLAAFHDAAVQDATVENLWTQNVPYLLVAKTAMRVAQTHLQDFELANSFAQLVAEAEARVSRFTLASRFAGYSTNKAGDE